MSGTSFPLLAATGDLPNQSENNIQVASTPDLTEQVKGRLLSAVPTAEEVEIYPSQRGRLILSFQLDERTHKFWLDRFENGWVLSEHRINGAPQPRVFADRIPRFELLVAAVVNSPRKPRVEVVELRCPDDPRRLFGKLIVQNRFTSEHPPSLIEFACPQCKRKEGRVTMHVFDSQTGEFVKTQLGEAWVKRTPVTPWNRQGLDEEGEHPEGSFLEARASAPY